MAIFEKLSEILADLYKKCQKWQILPTICYNHFIILPNNFVIWKIWSYFREIHSYMAIFGKLFEILVDLYQKMSKTANFYKQFLQSFHNTASKLSIMLKWTCFCLKNFSVTICRKTSQLNKISRELIFVVLPFQE